ncbi:hypothetical protein [Microvirga zambiensis]|uniref:hypothetical protein n=1 Tax=Microvirga zambiensis TaxID=1402137 RepID=UPI001FE2FCC5|nr:hypothetical protein [Microvirga zambiensis]
MEALKETEPSQALQNTQIESSATDSAAGKADGRTPIANQAMDILIEGLERLRLRGIRCGQARLGNLKLGLCSVGATVETSSVSMKISELLFQYIDLCRCSISIGAIASAKIPAPFDVNDFGAK